MNKLFRDVSYNAFQVLVNQVLGVMIFLLLSRYLDKPGFGELCWSLAVLTFVTTILSMRLEEVVVRNIAAGVNPPQMLALFLGHNLVTGSAFFLLLSAGNYFFPGFFRQHTLIWMLSISQLFTFFSLPFRQWMTGRSAFGRLALASTIPNLVRLAWLLYLIVFSGLTLRGVLAAYTVSSVVEWLTGAYLVFHQLHVPFRLKGNFSAYRNLIGSSLPQAGVVVLNAGLARMDWILMGFFSTVTNTAEYGFAYKAFELSPLPLIILAPFLLNRFSQWAVNGMDAPELVKSRADRVGLLVRFEMVMATLIPLWINLAWAPLVDGLTHNKYGQVNTTTFLILSCCIPFQYLVNVMWSHDFACNKLSRIFSITAITALTVVAGDFLLIPRFAGPGAATAYLAGMILQFFLYRRSGSFPYHVPWERYLLGPVAIAICSGISAIWLAGALLPRLLIATGFYVGLTVVAGQFSATDRSMLSSLMSGTHVAALARLYQRGKQFLQSIDWPLLAFLIMVLDVKLAVKAVALFLAFLWQGRAFISQPLSRYKWTRFYWVILLLAMLNLLLTGTLFKGRLDQTIPPLLSFGLGACYWIMAIAAAGHISLFISRGRPDRLDRTITCFFLLHVASVLVSFLVICLQAGVLNPYAYQGLHQKYFISTGDFIRDITLNGSVTAAVISAFGLFYFLYKRRYGLSVLCMITLLLAGSNFVDLLLMLTLLIIALIHTDKVQKSMAIVFGLMLIVFMTKVSPENKDYATGVLAALTKASPVDQEASPVDREASLVGQGESPVRSDLIPAAAATDETMFIPRPEMQSWQHSLRAFMDSAYDRPTQDSLNQKYKMGSMPGRWSACRQGLDFFRAHPAKLLLGAGMGKFSSHLAFKTAALGIDGSYPVRQRYVPLSFRDNYLYLFLYYHIRPQGGHSLSNSPDSVYGQLLSEYGIAGLLAFVFLYVFYFCRRARLLSYGFPLLIILGGIFLVGYWFEQLSVVILFECLQLLDRKDSTLPDAASREENPATISHIQTTP